MPGGGRERAGEQRAKHGRGDQRAGQHAEREHGVTARQRDQPDTRGLARRQTQRQDPSRAGPLTQLQIIDAAQRVWFSFDEIRDLVWGRGDPAHERLRQLALRKLPEIDELIGRATAVKHLLEICSTSRCETIADCRLLDEPLKPPPEQPGDTALKCRIARNPSPPRSD